jgi:SAM-dependent methyltransferase
VAAGTGSSEFDEFADKYEETMARASRLAGEPPAFYAAERFRWLRQRLDFSTPIETALDFGCGTGGSIRHFFEDAGCKTLIGIDPSRESLRVARERYSEYKVSLMTPEEFTPSGNIPFAFCNGVFHHIPPPERLSALAFVRACLTERGVFAFWENNPWNPVTLYGMRLNEFDRDAQTISPSKAIRLLKAAGFRIRLVDFYFFFPHFARGLRGLERWLKWLPVGAQYLVLAEK